MKDLLLEILGWLGYLGRPAVQLQLLLSVGLLLLTQLARRRQWLGRRPKLAYTAVGSAVVALACLALAAAGQPYELSLLLTVLWLGWSGLSLLTWLLGHWLPAEEVRQLDTRLLRPLYLLLATLLLISEVDSLRDLGVIPLGQLLGVTVSTEKVLHALLVTYVVLVACKPPAAALAWLLQRTLGISDGSRKATELMLRYLVVGLGLVAVAAHLGLNTTALIAVAGGLSVGLGFGIKEVFSNFVSGLWLLFEGSVRPGEVLMLDGEPCEVRRLGLRATLLWRDRDNAELLIPNQTFFTEATTTYTGSDRMRRSQVIVVVPEQQDPTVVINLLQTTALELPRVLRHPAPEALVLSYGATGIQYALRFWITNPLDDADICSAMHQAIWLNFQQHSIALAPAPPAD